MSVVAVRHGRGLPNGYVQAEKRRRAELRLQKVNDQIASVMRKKRVDIDRLRDLCIKQSALKIEMEKCYA